MPTSFAPAIRETPKNISPSVTSANGVRRVGHLNAIGSPNSPSRLDNIAGLFYLRLFARSSGCPTLFAGVVPEGFSDKHYKRQVLYGPCLWIA
jgi:hypothetical protein